MALLSVVVPGYNARQHLTTCLAGLRLNAANGIEFVFVDDASTDGTGDTVAAAVPDVPGLRLVRAPVNVGLASARNLGIDQARGRYIAFLDADDWLAKGYLAALLASARRHAVDFVRTDHVQVRGLSRTVHRAPVARRDVVLDPREHVLPLTETTMVDYPYAWAGLFDRERVPDQLLRFDEGLRTAEDRPWIWRLHRQCESFVVPSLLGHFYRREVATSLTAALDERQLDFVAAFRAVLDDLERDGEPQAFVEKAVRTFCAVLAHHLKRYDEMEPTVRHDLVTRSATLLDGVPPDLLGDIVSAFDPARREALQRVRGGRSRRRLLMGSAGAL